MEERNCAAKGGGGGGGGEKKYMYLQWCRYNVDANTQDGVVHDANTNATANELRTGTHAAFWQNKGREAFHHCSCI